MLSLGENPEGRWNAAEALLRGESKAAWRHRSFGSQGAENSSQNTRGPEGYQAARVAGNLQRIAASVSGERRAPSEPGNRCGL